MNSTYKDTTRLLHNSHRPMSLGCLGCTDRDECGGLYVREGLFNCLDLCTCVDRSLCQSVCPNREEDFVGRLQEVRGLGLNNVPRHAPIPRPTLPYVVPFVYNSSRRVDRLRAEAVALPLSALFDHRTGAPKFGSRDSLASTFRFDPTAKLVISGVDYDQPIENYWSHRRAAKLPEYLATLDPDLVTTPNYSLILDVPRWDNIQNIKRTVLCWSELTAAGVPAALHLNARTDHDWRRWTAFVAERDEVQSVAFEYATGAARLERGKWHTEKLMALAATAGRDLQLVVRGGYAHLRELEKAFGEVVFIDTNSFIKTVKRQRLDWHPGGKKHWRSAKTPRNYPLDDLLQHNADTTAAMISFTTSGQIG